MTNNSVSLEQIVHGILVVRSDLTREQVLRKIFKKKREFNIRTPSAHMPDTEAALMVASELWPKTVPKPKQTEQKLSCCKCHKYVEADPPKLVIRSNITGGVSIVFVFCTECWRRWRNFLRNANIAGADGKTCKQCIALLLHLLVLWIFNTSCEEIDAHQREAR